VREKKRVVVAMSGGVDSSVSAALLVDQGYEVIGMMMRLWSETGKAQDNRCCTPDSMAMARRVADCLEIPFYTIDAQEKFFNTVVTYFEQEYLLGNTPNPCLVCNRQIRWDFLLQHALNAGAVYMATGHYARLENDLAGEMKLLRAKDDQKDQSYVLHVLNQNKLRHALFPLGDYLKSEVRQLARDFNLPVADKAESQDLCFLGVEDYRSFLKRRQGAGINPGPILDLAGMNLGEHQGLAYYTIGQRKGLGITSSQPYYVVEKNLNRNALIVGNLDQLGREELVAENVNWISGRTPDKPFRAQVKIRYKASFVWGTIVPQDDNKIKIVFDHKLRDITSGQAAVIYNGQECLGGGLIANQ
jgi:tRNA-uridine 2-sulfurtransferase